MRTTLTVAGRELTERARSKAFLISNAVIVGVIALAALIPQLLPGAQPAAVAVFDDPSRAVVAMAGQAELVFGRGVEALEVEDRAAAEEAVADGRAAAALVDGRTLLSEGEPSAELTSSLRPPAQALLLERSLAEAGVGDAERQALLGADPLEVEYLAEPDPTDETDEGGAFIAFFGVMALYGLLIMYGQWVGQGIVEEKQSRVVEVLLSTVTPLQLLTGKVLGIGLLGLAQISVIAVAGSLAALYALPFDLPPETWGVVGLVFAWYLLGYAIYASLFACVGAVCARVEDFQAAATPVFVLIFGAIIGVQFALNAPDGTVAKVLGLVPFTAPLVQPVQAAGGGAGAFEVGLAVALGLAAIAALLPLAARVYSGGVLKTRTRVSLVEAWRSGSHG